MAKPRFASILEDLIPEPLLLTTTEQDFGALQTMCKILFLHNLGKLFDFSKAKLPCLWSIFKVSYNNKITMWSKCAINKNYHYFSYVITWLCHCHCYGYFSSASLVCDILIPLLKMAVNFNFFLQPRGTNKF